MVYSTVGAMMHIVYGVDMARTQNVPNMGISIYRGSTLLGKARDLTVEGKELTLELGLIDRFEVLRYLSPRVARDLIGEKAISEMPALTLYCEPSAIKKAPVGDTAKKVGKKKPAPTKDVVVDTGLVRLTFQPMSIEVNPMAGQNLSIKTFKGTLVGNMDTGMEAPKEEVAVTSSTRAGTSVTNTPTVLY